MGGAQTHNHLYFVWSFMTNFSLTFTIYLFVWNFAMYWLKCSVTFVLKEWIVIYNVITNRKGLDWGRGRYCCQLSNSFWFKTNSRVQRAYHFSLWVCDILFEAASHSETSLLALYHSVILFMRGFGCIPTLIMLGLSILWW